MRRPPKSNVPPATVAWVLFIAQRYELVELADMEIISERMYRLIYQTLSPSDELILSLLGPTLGRRQDLAM